LLKTTEKIIENRILAIANREASIDASTIAPLLSALERVELRVGEHLFRIGDKTDIEYFVVSGLLRTAVVNDEGDDVTLGYYDAPTVLSPSITRTNNGVSSVYCEAHESAVVFGFRFEVLRELMTKDPLLQHWGNAVLHNELLRRSQREFSLVTMNGSKRLIDFRERYGELEIYAAFFFCLLKCLAFLTH